MVDDESYEEIARVLGHSRSAVVAACKRLAEFGWLDWEPRWEIDPETGRPKQVRNLFWAIMPFAQLLSLGIAMGAAPAPVDLLYASEAGRAMNKRFEREIDNDRNPILARADAKAAAELAGDVADQETS